MKSFLRHHLFKCLALLIAIPTLLGVYFTDLNIIDIGLKDIGRIESNEIDEIVVVLVILVLALVVDQMRARSRLRLRSEIDQYRVQVLKATMRTVQDLVNNFLNNMQMFRMEAEDGPLSAESLQLFDTLIFETSEKITALGASEVVMEIQMASGIGIQAQPGLAIRNTHSSPNSHQQQRTAKPAIPPDNQAQTPRVQCAARRASTR